MKKLAIIFLPLSLTGCLHTQGAVRALDVAACAVEDERLRIAFTDPATAIAWLEETTAKLEDIGKRLGAGEEATDLDVAAINDASDLHRRLRKCLAG